MSEPEQTAGNISKFFFELEDFGAPPPKPKLPEPEPALVTVEAEPEPERISLTIAEFEARIATAQKEGARQGSEETSEALRQKYEATFATIIDEFKAENSLRYAAVEQAAEAFVGTVVACVSSLTRLEPDALKGLERDLNSDVAGLVEECEGKVTLSCNTQDAPLLQGILGNHQDVLIDAKDGVDAGVIRIVSADNSILVDTQQWHNDVVQKLIKTVTALAQQGMNKDESRQKEP